MLGKCYYILGIDIRNRQTLSQIDTKMTCHVFEIEIPIILIDVVNTYFLSKKPQVVKLELFMRKFNFMQIRKQAIVFTL